MGVETASWAAGSRLLHSRHAGRRQPACNALHGYPRPSTQLDCLLDRTTQQHLEDKPMARGKEFVSRHCTGVLSNEFLYA